MNNQQRNNDHKRNEDLENILQTLNSSFSFVENDLAPANENLTYPPVFIVGIARSGTTLAYQYLVSSGLFSYPSNIISRFYQAPYIGALLHKIFIDLDDKDEFFSKEIRFSSQLGKTQGAASPHEFWYYWRRFFNFREIQELSNEDLNNVNVKEFIKGLASIETVFNKPLLMKAMILNWNLDFLYKNIPNSIFVFIHRDPIMNMHSLYKARKSYFGDVTKWYSFLPPEYPALKNKSVYEQLAGQVVLGNKAIKEQIDKFDQKRIISIAYEDFCKKPEFLLQQVKQRLVSLSGINVKQINVNKKEHFEVRDNISDDDFELNKAQASIDEIRGVNE